MTDGFSRHKHVTPAVALLTVVAAGAWIGACRDGIVDTEITAATDTTFVSDPVPLASVALNAQRRSPSAPAATAVAFVALPPGTVPGGDVAIVRVRGGAGTLTTAMSAGGFDPVPVDASPGDTVEVEVRVSGGAPVVFTAAVPARRRPIVVRTDPPPRKRDVALNSGIVVVFSEPVDPASLTGSSVRLLRSAAVVPGMVTLLAGSSTAAVFVPDAALDMNTDYLLVVTQAVRDLRGDALAAPDSVPFTTGTTNVSPAYYAAVVPDTTVILTGSQVQLTVAALDTNGSPLAGRPVIWTTNDPAVASVSSTGLVTALAEGEAHIHASVDFANADAVVFVTQTLTSVSSLVLTPESATIPVTGRVQLVATLLDSAGNILRFRPVTWSTSDAMIATVDPVSAAANWVSGVATGTTTIIATSDGKSDSAVVTVVGVGRYVTIDAGDGHTCAVAEGLWVSCWGNNLEGQLGTGVSGGNALVPQGVAGTQQFAQVAAYMGRTCAVTPAGVGYCWGFNHDGVLGTAYGSPPQPAPLLVPGGLRFTTIGVGQHHMCGLTVSGAAFCWGENLNGELGNGDTTACANTPCTTVPVAVAGGLTFTSLSVGDSHACGVTASGAAYCWGFNWTGQLGDGSTVRRATPVVVSGGLQFATLSAGYYHTCGITSDSLAYCWGLNGDGQLGVATTTGPESCITSSWGPISCSTVPALIASPLRWSDISASGQLGHTCALTPDGAAYCWGTNSSSQLGTGGATGPGECRLSNPSCSPNPLPVAGGLVFARVSAGAGHTCAVTVTNIAYCWGGNWLGELGNGTTAESNVPVRVLGQP